MIMFDCPKCGGALVDQRIDTGGRYWRCSVCGLTDKDITYIASSGTGMMPDEVAALKDEIASLRDENERLCAALKLAQARAADYDADIEAGRLVTLPAAVGQMVYVPSGDGGVYGAYVKDIGVLRPDAHDAIMRATVRVGLESKTLEYLIALENKGTHWFDTDEAARAALEGGQQ